MFDVRCRCGGFVFTVHRSQRPGTSPAVIYTIKLSASSFGIRVVLKCDHFWKSVLSITTVIRAINSLPY
uniref:Uncharacterized protein n=1 Tax=Panagrellus redivivus TaxID=6233 RepID=A0A7E4VT83_PANRE